MSYTSWAVYFIFLTWLYKFFILNLSVYAGYLRLSWCLSVSGSQGKFHLKLYAFFLNYFFLFLLSELTAATLRTVVALDSFLNVDHFLLLDWPEHPQHREMDRELHCLGCSWHVCLCHQHCIYICVQQTSLQHIASPLRSSSTRPCVRMWWWRPWWRCPQRRVSPWRSALFWRPLWASRWRRKKVKPAKYFCVSGRLKFYPELTFGWLLLC